MADLEERNPAFEITVDLDGNSKKLSIQPDETSDGVEYFICKSGEDQITQIRLDEDGNWDQMWGELTQEEVNTIGQAITESQENGI